VAATANNAYESAIRIVTLFAKDRERITAAGDHANSMLRVHELLQSQPFVNAAQVRAKTNLSMPTVNHALAALGKLGVAREVTGKKRGRVFAYDGFLNIIDEGTDVTPGG